jgi:hypothetical protein
MITGNKGEWSEIYTFFKLLADGKVYSGDGNLNKIDELFYPIIRVLREEKTGIFEYHLDKNVILVLGGDKEIRVPFEVFKDQAELLFAMIRKKRGSFSLPEIEDFMSSIYCKTLKAKSIDKTDIKIVVHDLRTGLQHQLGFSVKSKLGSASTLLNSNGDTTSFIFRVTGINDAVATEINQIKKFQKKFDCLRKLNATIHYVAPAGKVFNNNLVYVDSALPEIIGNITLIYYSTPKSRVSDIVNMINGENPLGFDYSHEQDFYEHKVKRFLTDIALGLKPGTPFRGKYEATGGYLIVKEDGDVICYHIYDKNQFEDYLFNNTRLDTPSTTRHEFGNIYENDGQFFIKLNLQVRFI